MSSRVSFVFIHFLRLPVVLAIVLTGCGRQSSARQSPAAERPAAPVSRIVYRIEVLSDRSADASTYERTVYFDGKRSAVTEQTNDYGFPGRTTVFASAEDSIETYMKVLPYVTFQLRRERSVPDGMGIPVGQQGSFTKTILGYRCRQLLLETDRFRYSVWYTTDVSAHDPTHAVVQDAQVPGLILEMDKTLKGRNDWHTVMVVTAFEPESERAAVLQIPQEAIVVDDAQEALVRHRLLFEEAMQREKPLSREEQQQFPGNWQAKNGQSVQLRIERYGEAYTYVERRAGETTSGMAHFYGNRLLLERGDLWRTYFRDAEGNLRSDQEGIILRKKR